MSDRTRNLIVASCMVIITVGYLRMLRRFKQSQQDTDSAFAALREKILQRAEQ